MQRFSEDIDFDVFTKNAKLEQIVNIDGFEVEGPWKFRNTLRFHLTYPFLGRKDNVRVEFSLNKLPKTMNPIGDESMNSEVTGSTLYGVPCYSFDDLVARKMNALRDRTEGKDVWDCFHALPKTTDIKRAIKFALLSERLHIDVGDSLNKTLTNLKKIEPKELMKLTNPYIPTSLRPKDWGEIVESLQHQIQELL
jgi:predicted nucleotidyltransferase component of viral defense system